MLNFQQNKHVEMANGIARGKAEEWEDFENATPKQWLMIGRA